MPAWRSFTAMCVRWRNRLDARSAFWPTYRDRKFAWARWAAAAREVHKGDRLILVRKSTPDNMTDIPIPHAEVFAALQAGENILIDDGKIRLKIESTGKDRAEAIVETGGVLKDKKGVNLPDTVLAYPGHDAQGPQRSRCGAASGRGLDRTLLSCSVPTTSPK